MSRWENGESGDSTAVTCQPGEFLSFDGARICFDVYDRPGPETVLVLPGFWRHRRYPSMVQLGRRLQASGYRCVIADLRGHGESGGRFGFNTDEWRDVELLLRVLRSDYGAGPIDLFGMSAGGAVAISTAARSLESLNGLFLLSPVANFRQVIPRINPFTIHRHIAFGQAFAAPRFVWNRRRCLPALDDIANVRVPVALVHVRNDWLVSHRHSERLFAAANDPKELHVFDIPGHWHADRIFGVDEDRVEALLLSFLARTLGATQRTNARE